MPIITTLVAPPPVVTPPPPPPPIKIPEVGYASVTYIDPTGGVWPMTDRSRDFFALSDGISGLGAAPYELTTDDYPRGGSRLRHAQPVSRSIVWPIHVQGDTHQEFTDQWRALARAFTRTLREGPGILEFARPNGDRRQIRVYYQEGFEGLGRPGTGLAWDRAVLTLYCEDPYFYDAVPRVVHREQSAGEDFFAPYPSVSSSQVLGATTVTNPGDVVVWPEWTITGPASLVTFTHTGTGEQFVLDPTKVGHGNLLAGEKVTVTTDPPRVRYQNGDNWVGTLNWPSAVLWGLQPGDNAVTFALSGSGPGSAVDLTYSPRYETA